MIERVARAISPELWETQDGLEKFSPDYFVMPTQIQIREQSRKRAIGVIKAFRVPSKPMIAAAYDYKGVFDAIGEDFVDLWETIIDVALDPCNCQKLS